MTKSGHFETKNRVAIDVRGQAERPSKGPPVLGQFFSVEIQASALFGQYAGA